jgi:hypothetical protein
LGPTGNVSFVDTTNGNLVLGTAALGPATFAQNAVTAPAIPVGKNPIAIAIGDFNGDGISDLAVVNSVDNNVSILLGNTSNDFTSAVGSPVAVGKNPAAVAVGDFNSDGIADLAVVNGQPNNVSVLLGDGSGGFAGAAGSPVAVGRNPAAVAVGDFNQDGIADLAVANTGDNTVTILLGDGSGGFSTAAGSPVLVGSNPASIDVGDYNADNITDLAVVNNGSNTVNILLGDGNGGFSNAAGSPVPVGKNPESSVTGDFNGDGIADLAVVNNGDNNVSILLGNGSGGFSNAAGSPVPVGTNPTSLAVADFNRDSIADLAVTNSGPNHVSTLLGDGNGGFSPTAQSPAPVGNNPAASEVGDFNGDGIAGLAVVNGGSNDVSVISNLVTQTATATLTSVNVPGTGTHDVNAAYTGDTNFGASTSPTIPLTATGVTTSLALSAAPTSSTYGQPVVLTATLSPNSEGSLSTNGQSITFYSNGSPLGAATLSSGVANLSTTSLSTGVNSLLASYAGDADFQGSTSPNLNFTVTPATPTITWSAPGSISYGTPLSATQLNATANVPGTLVYSPASGTVLSTGSHVLGTTFTPTDSANYTTATASVTLTVTKATPGSGGTSPVSVASSLNPSTYGGPVTFTATVPSDATGTVAFFNGSNPMGTGIITAGRATFTTSVLPSGTYGITAQYGGDSNYNAATSASLSQGVNTAVLTVTADNQARPYGQSNPTLTSTITGFINGDTSSVVSGAASLTTTATATSPVGAYPIVAALGTLAAANYTFSLVNGTLSVTKAIPGSGGTAAVIVASSLNPSTYGQSVTFTTTVPTGATGTVTFADNGTAISNAIAITGTTAAYTTSSLLGGAHPISGIYSGDSNHNGATSAAIAQQVNQLSSSTTLTLNPTTVMYGDTATLTAKVTPSGATGTVTFMATPTGGGSGVTLGTSSIDGSGTAVWPASMLPAGIYNLVAYYNGNPNYSASSSPTAQLTVTKRTGSGPGGAGLTVTVNDASRTAIQTNPPFSYTVSGTLINGDSYDTAVVGTPVYSSYTGSSAGSYPIAVTGLTSANYQLAFAPGTLTVVPSVSTTALVASTTSSQYGDSVTLTATVTNGATGTVSFYSPTVYLGGGTVSGGVATLTTTMLNAGSHLIIAIYNGDGTYASSTSSPVTVAVAKKTGTGPGGASLTVTVESASREYGAANPEFVYAVSGSLVNGDTYANAVIGVPVYSVADTPTSPAGSTFGITVSGLVSQNYTLAFVPGTLTIVSAVTTTGLSLNVTSVEHGDPLTGTASVTPSGTGTVNFVSGAIVVGQATLSGGVAELSSTTVPAGTYVLTALYQGDSNYSASASEPANLTVTKRAGSGPNGAALTVTVNSASRTYGQGNPAFSYTVSGTLVNNDTYSSAITGVPVYSTPATVTSPVGSYPISISNLNSANYAIGFVNGTLTVTKGTPALILTSFLNPSLFGQSVTFTTTPSAGATGTVNFIDGTATLCRGVAIVSGTASCTTTDLSAGTHTITAVYSGDANYNGVTSAGLSQVVSRSTPGSGGVTAVTVASSSNPSPAGTAVTFTATVPTGATGSTTFFDGATSLGNETISNGKATLTTSTLVAGTHSITAQYGGDSNYNSATSIVLSEVITSVADFAISAMPATQIIPPGASAAYTIQITSVTAPFTNAVTFTATGLPTGSSSTFSPVSVMPGANGTTSTLTVTVPKQTAMLRRDSGIPLVLAVLMLPLAGLRRQRSRVPRVLLWLLIMATSFGVITGCGVGGYFNQPERTYTITVTGTSGSLVHRTTTALTVQ